MIEHPNPCTACGTESVPGASFCHRCGATLGGGPSDRPDEPLAGRGSEGEDAASSGGAPFRAGQEGAPPPWSGGGASHQARSGAEPWGSAARDPGPGTGAAGTGAEIGSMGTGSATGTGPAASPAPEIGPGPARGAGEAAASGPDSDDEGIGRALRGGYPIRIGDWMGRGWTVFTQAGGLFIGFGAIFWLLFTFAGPLLLVLAPVLSSGFFIGALVVRRGGRLQFSDFWLLFNDFLPLFLAWLVGCALLFAGLLTCGVVTVYLWVAYQFAYLLIIDRGVDFWDALEASRRAVTRQWFGIFALVVLLLVLNVVAFLVTFSLGILVTIPLTSCVLVEAYADIFGVRGRLAGRGPSRATMEAPPTPPPVTL